MSSAIIIGASSGLGRALTETLAAAGNDVIVCARKKQDLEALASHLQIVYGVKATAVTLDLANISTETAATFVQQCFQILPELNQIYITAGIIDDNDKGAEAAAFLQQLMQVNCIGISYVFAEFCKHLKDKNSNITLISSIAAIRPRSANISYSASKIALEYFAKGTRHFYAESPMKIQLWRAGYMDTALSRGKKLLLPVAKPEAVAKTIFNNRNKNFGMRYVPFFWFPVAVILQCLPWGIFKKLKF